MSDAMILSIPSVLCKFRFRCIAPSISTPYLLYLSDEIYTLLTTMRRLALLILGGMLALFGFATAQFCELIYDGGVRKSMCSLLLEPDSTTFSMIRNRLPQGLSNTALLRNYIGCWKIKNDSLFLDSVLVNDGSDSYRPISIDDIFAEKRTASGYFSDWVSDSLRVVSGDIIKYVHMAWESKWENEELIAVENGIVKKRIHKHNRLVNKGMEGLKLRSLPDSLDLGEIPRRITLNVSYSDFDTEGNPTSCKVIVRRGSGDAATDNRVATAIEKFILTRKPLPIYYIDNRYVTHTYTITVGPSRND